MLRRIDAVGFVGIAFVALGLFFLFVGRHYPTHSNIWRDWLLAFVLVILGGALAIAWSLIRVFGTGVRGSDEDREAKPKKMAKAAGTGQLGS